MWSFRSGTLDQLIFASVVADNEYRLPDRFEPEDVVVDVGAHIGSFTHAVVLRGGQQIWSIEPDRANCALAAEHLRPYADQGYVRLIHAAAWRSDPNDDELRFDGYHAFPQSYPGMEGVLNTGGGSVCGASANRSRRSPSTTSSTWPPTAESAASGCSSWIAKAPNGRSC